MIYSEAQPIIQTGDVILWRGRSLISRAIRIWSEFSHASLAIRFDQFGSGERRYILEAIESGIELRLLSNRIKEYDGQVFLYRLAPEWDHLRQVIADWAMLQVGCPYDYGSLIRNMFGRVAADCKRFFCSEFVFQAYREAGLIGIGKAPRPGDIASWPIFQEPVELRIK